MIDVQFKYTPAEIARWNALNRFESTPAWLLFVMATLCVMPSLMIAFWAQWFGLSLVFSLLSTCLMFLAVRAYWFPARPRFQEIERQRIYGQHSRYEKISHSEFETNWSTYLAWSESEFGFELRRPGHTSLEPGRLFTPTQATELRALLHQIPAADRDGGQTPMPLSEPVHLFLRLKTQIKPELSASLRYQIGDFENAVASTQRLIPEEPASWQGEEESPSKRTAGESWLPLLFLLMVIAPLFIAPVIYDVLNGQGEITVGTILVGGLTVVAPFVLIWLAYRVYFRPAHQRSPELPEQDYIFALLPSGWMVGAPETVTFYHWRDVEAFYENPSSWIIACLGQRILIPKRIFGQGQTSSYQQFLRAAFRLRRTATSSGFQESGKGRVGTETGNPFQAPSSDVSRPVD